MLFSRDEEKINSVKNCDFYIFRINGDNAAMKISSTTYPGCIHDNMLYFTVLKKKMKRSLTKAVVNIVTMQLRIALIQPACGSISIDAMQS